MSKVEKFLDWYGVYYDPAAGRWVYPTPCLPGMKEAGKREYEDVVQLVDSEIGIPTMRVLFEVSVSELRNHAENFTLLTK